MTIFLRQSTASQELPLGPFVDSTDGNTQETALSIANTDIKIWKTGGTTEASKNSGGATHIANGRYYCVLDATDTDTIGPMRVYCHPSGALAVWVDCVVLDEAVYDWLFGTSAPNTTTPLDAAGVRTAVGLASANLDTQLAALPTATENATEILGTAVDTGVSVEKALEMLAAFVAGKVSASSAGGVTTLSYKQRDGSTVSFTCLGSETDGTRVTTGSLS